jgi:glycosyltransferase involved in cell wall biosynthesis
MHLVINAMEVGRRRGGNESYLVGLTRGLAAIEHSVDVTLLTCGSHGKPSLPARFRQLNLGKYRRLPFFLWQQTIALYNLEADWYISTFFLPPITPCRGAVLVHDLSFRAHPEYFPPVIAFYMRFLTEMAINQADRVIALSEFTLRELKRFHPTAPLKATVVYPGVDPAFGSKQRPEDEQALRSYGIDPRYILAMGNIHPRKNLARLLDAYLMLKAERESIPPMVWAGLQRWTSDELVRWARSTEVILPGFISQEDLPALYRQATMLVYPSLYEGFGLPPLEAMACGTPVVTSNTTSLPEVMGDAALTVNPTAVEAIAEAMARLLDNVSLQQQLRQLGLQRAKKFSWTRTARHLLEVLDDA